MSDFNPKLIITTKGDPDKRSHPMEVDHVDDKSDPSIVHHVGKPVRFPEETVVHGLLLNEYEFVPFSAPVKVGPDKEFAASFHYRPIKFTAQYLLQPAPAFAVSKAEVDAMTGSIVADMADANGFEPDDEPEDWDDDDDWDEDDYLFDEDDDDDWDDDDDDF